MDSNVFGYLPMCSPKAYIKDGASRFITPSDFTKLKQKAMLDKVKQAEELLGKGYELLQASPDDPMFAALKQLRQTFEELVHVA